MSKIELSFATIEYKEPIVYFRMEKAIVMDEKQVKQVIDAGLELCANKPHVVLADMRVQADVTHKAREYGSKRENTGNLRAQAVVVKWLAQRLIANVFIEVNKPHYPMRVFNDEDKAVKWLMSQKL